MGAATSYYQFLNHFVIKKEDNKQNDLAAIKSEKENSLIEMAKRNSFGIPEYLKNITVQSFKRSSLDFQQEKDQNITDEATSNLNTPNNDGISKDNESKEK